MPFLSNAFNACPSGFCWLLLKTTPRNTRETCWPEDAFGLWRGIRPAHNRQVDSALSAINHLFPGVQALQRGGSGMSKGLHPF